MSLDQTLMRVQSCLDGPRRCTSPAESLWLFSHAPHPSSTCRTSRDRLILHWSCLVGKELFNDMSAPCPAEVIKSMPTMPVLGVDVFQRQDRRCLIMKPTFKEVLALFPPLSAAAAGRLPLVTFDFMGSTVYTSTSRTPTSVVLFLSTQHVLRGKWGGGHCTPAFANLG